VLSSASRSTVQYSAVAAMAIDAGTTTRLRYQVLFRQYHPTNVAASPITVSCPASTPKLKDTSAVMFRVFQTGRC
jgi:hypothetical protein